MPLIQWIMQNLGKTFTYDGSGSVIVYGSALAGYSENFYSVPIKFSIGAKAFDVGGSVWTITGISATTSRGAKYTAKRGTSVRIFYDSEIFANQQKFSCVDALQKCLDKPMENLPTYPGRRKVKG